MITRTTLSLLIVASSLRISLCDQSTRPKKPHIILILADDLGYDDVSWHNKAGVQMPNIHSLAKKGIILEQSYVYHVCTPTRSALLTGKYAHKLGQQRGVILPLQPSGLNLERDLLSQLLKKAGYSTHAVGKWHLGFCSWDYTPTRRGFDTFFGFYLGSQDYYNHSRGGYINDVAADGSRRFRRVERAYDFRHNTLTDYSVNGEYSTFTFASHVKNLLRTRNKDDPMFLYLALQSVHGPLQVPERYTKPFEYVKDETRRTKLGMILAMDELVGQVVNDLKDTKHYDNSVIVFLSDNGGDTKLGGSNWPLRGKKSTLWEGGTRSTSFVHSPLVKHLKGTKSDKLIHVTDWFPTLVGLAGGETPSDTDGYDQWDAIVKPSTASPRNSMVYNIDVYRDPLTSGHLRAGVRIGDYKLIIGGLRDIKHGDWHQPSEYSSNRSPKHHHHSHKHRVRYHHFRGDRASTDNHLTKEKRINKFKNSLDNDKAVDNSERRQPREGPQKESRSPRLQRKDDMMYPQPDSYDGDGIQLKDIDVSLGQFGILSEFLNGTMNVGLYNLKDDPEERINLASDKPVKVAKLLTEIENHMKDYVKPVKRSMRMDGIPSFYDNTWSPGWC